jgi:outer membrane immunogenic protein
MKRIVASLFALATLGVQAHAADMRVVAPMSRAPAPVYVPFSWTGFYVGGNIGYGWADANATVTAFGVTATGTDKLNGVVGGGQIGYNWQNGNLVWGIEADFQGTGQQLTSTAAGVSVKDELPWFGTLRGRLGWTPAERWMIYVTGGGGWVDFKSTVTVAGLGTATWEKSHGAWTIGGGVENAIDNHWSWKVEYLYLDTGSFNTTLFGVVPASAKIKDNVARFGINYRF